MASKYIVRRPIKDTDSRVIGYEILYHGENRLYGSMDSGSRTNEFAVADTIYSFLTQNTEKSLKGSLNFMTFTVTLLMKKVPRLFEKSDLVIQIDDSVIVHPLAMHFVRQYKREGYKIAVNEFQFVPRYLSMIDQIDYIKLNVQTMSDVALHNILEIAHGMGKHCVATEVDTEALYQKALALGVHAMEGAYVAEKLATKVHNSSYLQSNFFRLMVEVTRDDPDMEEIERIITMDATLTYGILRMSNSVHFARRNRTTTVRAAIVNLGLSQLRQWVYLLSASNGDQGLDLSSEEFLKRSFLRASFCSELMNYAKSVPLSKGEAYLMGMFSTLHYLIDAPQEEILSQIPVADEVKEALLTGQGPAGMLYGLVTSYEAADWQEVNMLSEQLGIPGELLSTVYFECMDAAEEIWKSMTA